MYSNLLLTLLKPKGWYLGERCSKTFAKPWPVKYPALVWVGEGDYVDWCISNSSLTSQCNSGKLPSANCLDAFPLISSFRLLLPINSNLMMHVCGFQRSRIHVPSVGRTFCIIYMYLSQSEYSYY